MMADAAKEYVEKAQTVVEVVEEVKEEVASPAAEPPADQPVAEVKQDEPVKEEVVEEKKEEAPVEAVAAPAEVPKIEEKKEEVKEEVKEVKEEKKEEIIMEEENELAYNSRILKVMLHLNDQITAFSTKVDNEIAVTKAVVEALAKPDVKSEDELKKLTAGSALLVLHEKHTDDNLMMLLKLKNFEEQLQKINEVYDAPKMTEKELESLSDNLATRMTA